MPTSKAIVETATGRVLNVIMIEPDSNYTIPSGHQYVDPGPGAQPGATWDGAVFTPPPTPPTRIALLQQLEAGSTITPEEAEELLRLVRRAVLEAALAAGTISMPELIELLKLERGL